MFLFVFQAHFIMYELFRKLHYTLYILVSAFSIFILIKQECLTPLRVLHLYFYSVTVFSVRGTISHMAVDLFQHTHTL